MTELLTTLKFDTGVERTLGEAAVEQEIYKIELKIQDDTFVKIVALTACVYYCVKTKEVVTRGTKLHSGLCAVAMTRAAKRQKSWY
jgi:hypothetical protein